MQVELVGGAVEEGRDRGALREEGGGGGRGDEEKQLSMATRFLR